MHLPRFKKFRPGILSWLFALVLLTGLPLVGYLVYTVRSMGEQHQDFVLANMERRSESISGEVSQLVVRSVGGTGTFALPGGKLQQANFSWCSPLYPPSFFAFITP